MPHVSPTITVDFHDATTYFHRLGHGKAFLTCRACVPSSLGFQLTPKASGDCGGGHDMALAFPREFHRTADQQEPPQLFGARIVRH